MGYVICHCPPPEDGLTHRALQLETMGARGLTLSRHTFTAGEWADHAVLGLVYSLPLASNGHLLPFLSFTFVLAQVFPPMFPQEFRSLQRKSRGPGSQTCILRVGGYFQTKDPAPRDTAETQIPHRYRGVFT